ncbi:hypothetical protein AGRA3207_007862 (plasmid) [Actinomadura graeca]|uniref:DUF222 domain-containing protein n=1 Tax=Actinomadura graeca TaxID=2750812 RepID=A0ABX8R7L9_9ACTN|nr:hypothetical protein [Actinomadura graeca]QXJ27065.1 hypothetical protein AGRA3207_007862 [Actinomadura graeca]
MSKLLNKGRLGKTGEADPAAPEATGQDQTPATTTDTADTAAAPSRAGKRAARPPAGPGTVPAPPAAEVDAEGALNARERADLAACEAALDGLRLAFWAAGKALQTIRDARLYRAGHDTFERYVTDRWGMQTSQAYRLIAAWPVAEALSPIGDRINEAQVRELLPLAARHGTDAAVTVYETVVEVAADADDVKVTAAVLRGAVGVVADAEAFDPARAADDIRAYLTGQLGPDPAAPADPAEAFTAEADRLRAAVTRTVGRPAFRDYARQNPDAARAVVAELRALLDSVEADADGETGGRRPGRDGGRTSRQRRTGNR